VEQAAFHVRDNVKIVRGRSFEPGKNEVVVGTGAAQEFAGLEIGNKFRV
jgi:putative ABC transport system permease protein